MNRRSVQIVVRPLILRAASVVLPLLLAMPLLHWPSSAFGQAVDPGLWVTDLRVTAVERAGQTLYIGGDFNFVGPATGGGVPTDAASGVAAPSFPKVAGNVWAVAPDGSGGWFLGGRFTSVGGVPRFNLAHILSDMSLSPWDPNAGVTSYVGNLGFYGVRALAVSGSTVYAAGDFTMIGGLPRNRIAAIDAATGAVTAWDPNASPASTIWALGVSGTTVYAGGDFLGIGGQSRTKIAAIDATTGLATAFDAGSLNDDVLALAIDGSTIYIGGTFTNVGGQMRNYTAALDATTGALSAWDPHISDRVYAIAAGGGTVYVGGRFCQVGSDARCFLAAIDASTGAATSWNPAVGEFGLRAGVSALTLTGTTLYAGGGFVSMNGNPRGFGAAFDITSGNLTSWNPGANGDIAAICVSGTTAYTGGQFSSIGALTRRGLAAIDLATGEATSWNPNVSGPVYSIIPNGSVIYIAGAFHAVGGMTRECAAAIDATTGVPTSWNPNCNNIISCMGLSGSTMYLGGDFTSVGGIPRNRLAAVDIVAGAAMPWDPGADATVSDLGVGGSTIYIGGLFSNVGGQVRNRLAAIDASSGAVTPWNPDADGGVFKVLVDGCVVYAGGYFHHLGAQQRDAIAAIDAVTGMPTTWIPNVYGSGIVVEALERIGSTLYVGGDFLNFGFCCGGVVHNLVGVDVVTGALLPWIPDVVGPVHDIAVASDRVYAGGSFSSVNGFPQVGLAAIDRGAVQDVSPNICNVTGTISGHVTADCPAPGSPMLGVGVDAFASGSGDLIGVAVTDAAGSYSLPNLPAGNYIVTAVVPLGYSTSAIEQPVTLQGGTASADFALHCVAITSNPRSIGFWKHQVGVTTGGPGHADISATSLCSYLDLVAIHFNNNLINQVVVYQPPTSNACSDKLQVAKTLLNLVGSEAMSARARQQLMALLLNVAAGYISQTKVISTDGATVSQAITYCDNVIDSPTGNYEKAKTIADTINNGMMVPTGMIPLSTLQIAYRKGMEALSFRVTPNPGSSAREFRFMTGAKGPVTLRVFDMSGRLVAELANGSMDAGAHSVAWDGRITTGAAAARGLYFARLQTPRESPTIKVLQLAAGH